MPKPRKLICIAVITSAHGIKGAVKMKSFAKEPADIANYSPLYSKDGGKQYPIKILSENGDMLIVQINGLKDRNEAEKLSGTELFIYRDMLPEVAEDEFYYEDLIGLEAKEPGSYKLMGMVTAVYNHGAGDIIEVKINKTGKTELLAFSKQTVPEINIEEGYVTISLPEVQFVGDNDN